MIPEDGENADSLKEAGNVAFKNKDWDLALKCYTKAIRCGKSEAEQLLCYKNRAAVYLKQEKYDEAIADATKVLESSPNDPKALYRRCQALEKLNRFEEAYRDATHLLRVDPANKEVQPVLSRLYRKVQEYATKNAEVNVKIANMYNYAFNAAEIESKRETAMNNILVLAKEPSGAKALFDAQIVDKICHAMKSEKSVEIRVTALHVLSELMKDVARTKSIVSVLGVPWFLDLLDSSDETVVHACQNVLQTMMAVLSGTQNDECDAKVCAENKTEIDTILTCMVYTINSRSVSGLARDAVLQLLTKNVHFKGIDWANRFVEIGGIQKLLEVASEVSEYADESSMKLTSTTKSLVAGCLARIYESMYYEKARQDYLDAVNEFMKAKLLTPDIESKVKVTVAIMALLTGPLEVGNYIMGKDGIMEMMLAMATSDDVVQQKAACECIVASITKQDKAQFVVAKGVDILKKLFHSEDEAIRIRALVGLCKAATAGGTDASFKLFAEGATKKMAEACKKFLVRGHEVDTRRWAAEGFAYLSFDAEVKEMLIDDELAIRALIEVAKSNVQTSTVYAIVNVLVNLCNAYDKKEILPEMIELAKFAKRHIPEQHEFDDDDFVTKRVNVLGKLGITTALVALANSNESANCKELICRVFNALCSQSELRGLVVQQGGVKVLVKMALEGTENGKRLAAQSLARIGITMNPEVAFPGQRCLEIVRPLIGLLHPECPALMNFEAMMALCNLASLSESVRERIINEKGISRIESYLYEEHELLRRAATQCITNLAMSPRLVEVFEGDNDKFKYMLLLCGEEDEETAKAACGAVAILTGASEKCCGKVFKVTDWLDIMRQTLAHPNAEVQERAVAIVQNVIESNKENAEELMSSQVMEILMALTLVHDEGKEKVRERAEKCLRRAEELEVIKKSDDKSDEE